MPPECATPCRAWLPPLQNLVWLEIRDFLWGRPMVIEKRGDRGVAAFYDGARPRKGLHRGDWRGCGGPPPRLGLGRRTNSAEAHLQAMPRPTVGGCWVRGVVRGPDEQMAQPPSAISFPAGPRGATTARFFLFCDRAGRERLRRSRPFSGRPMVFSPNSGSGLGPQNDNPAFKLYGTARGNQRARDEEKGKIILAHQGPITGVKAGEGASLPGLANQPPRSFDLRWTLF